MGFPEFHFLRPRLPRRVTNDGGGTMLDSHLNAFVILAVPGKREKHPGISQLPRKVKGLYVSDIFSVTFFTSESNSVINNS